MIPICALEFKAKNWASLNIDSEKKRKKIEKSTLCQVIRTEKEYQI